MRIRIRRAMKSKHNINKGINGWCEQLCRTNEKKEEKREIPSIFIIILIRIRKVVELRRLNIFFYSISRSITSHSGFLGAILFALTDFNIFISISLVLLHCIYNSLNFLGVFVKSPKADTPVNTSTT